MWKKIRIAILLYILFMVAVGAWLTAARSTDWNETLWVAVYPINGDNSAVSGHYIDKLDDESFDIIERYIRKQADKYGLNKKLPIKVKLGPEVKTHPPEPPASGNPLSIAWWSLKLRWWASNAESDKLPASVRLFVLYHDPETNPRLRHSLGLKKGLLGVVNAFASKSMAGQNKMIITHEMLHTLGATDKYDPVSNMPIYPAGYAEPDRDPLWPQRKAEIMGGRIAKSETSADIPRSLKKTLIGPLTAAEINWVKAN